MDGSPKPRMARESHGRIQGRAGVKLRQRRLQRTNYLCEDCLDAGLTRLAEQVDHVIPLHAGGEDVDSNTRNLCSEHHRDKTNLDMGYRIKRTTAPDGWPE
jgi:5-methylcytosine-specific restriction protein A